MKITITTLLIFLLNICNAQNDSLAKAELRKLQIQELPELTDYTRVIYDMADSSFITGNAKWMYKLDSLAKDSVIRSAGAGFVADLEMAFLRIRNSNHAPDASMLGRLMENTNTLDTQTQYFARLYSWMQSKLIESGDWKQAYACSQQLNEAKINGLSSEIQDITATSDSLSDALAANKAVLKKSETEAAQSVQLWMIIAGGISVLLLAVTVFFAVSRSGLRRKLIEQTRKSSDRTELEDLMKKINDARSANEQLKSSLNRSGEKLTAMEDSRRMLIQHLKQLADEINTGIDEVKSQSEANKTGMNPTAYMAIQNAVTRMGNTIAQRFQSLSDSLK
jgi:hypothetical protein